MDIERVDEDQTPTSEDDSPRVTVVICTRNRPDDLPAAVASVLRCDHPSFELRIVDQGTDSAAADLVAEIDDDRLVHIPTDTVGLSRARNIGMASAHSDIVLMTDDDCVVSTDWISQMERALLSSDHHAVVFGHVDAAECDDSLGFVPDGPITADRTITKPSRYDPREGIGASIGFRRSRAIAAGGFDEQLGAGAPFRSAEEIDLVLRMMLRGWSVVHTTSARLVHHGFRTFDQGRGLVRGYALGTAAAHTKLIRLGHPTVVASFARALWGTLVPPTVSAIRSGRLPPIVGRLGSTARGVWAGLTTPTNRQRLTFEP